MDAALRPGQDEPDAVKMVAVVLRVVRRQDDPRGAGEVEEAGNCKGRAVGVRGYLPSFAGATEDWPWEDDLHLRGKKKNE